MTKEEKKDFIGRGKRPRASSILNVDADLIHGRGESRAEAHARRQAAKQYPIHSSTQKQQAVESFEDENIGEDLRDLEPILDMAGKINAATWEQRNAQLAKNWKKIYEELANGVQYGHAAEAITICDCTASRAITAITFYGLKEIKPFCVCDVHWAKQLTSQGFFPCTPVRPSYVIETRLLRFYGCQLQFAGGSQESFARGLQLLLQKEAPVNIVDFYDNFRGALTAFWRVERIWRERKDPAYASLRRLCPSCFGENAESAVVCLDGNFQHRRYKNRAMKSANIEIKGKFWLRNLTAGQLISATSSERSTCSPNFKADNQESASSRAYEETGLMLASCRHDIPLRAINIVQSGERYAYPLALLRNILEDGECPENVVVVYDVSCRFSATARANLPATQFKRLEFKVPAFHVAAHGYGCQVVYHPCQSERMGLSDGESCERVWSMIRHVVSSSRYCASSFRLLQLERLLLGIGERKRLTMQHWFANMQRRAIATQKHCAEVLQPALCTYSKEVLWNYAREISDFYSNKSRTEPTIQLSPEKKFLYELVKGIRCLPEDSASRLAAKYQLELRGESVADWIDTHGAAYEACHRVFLVTCLFSVQKDLWKELSGKQNQLAALANYTGVRQARLNVGKYSSLSQRCKTLLAKYNTLVEEARNLRDPPDVRPVKTTNIQELDLDCPLWDLERLSISASWCRDRNLLTYVKFLQQQRAADIETRLIQQEKTRYNVYLEETIKMLENVVGPNINPRVQALIRIQKGALTEAYADMIREDFMVAAMDAIHLEEVDRSTQD